MNPHGHVSGSRASDLARPGHLRGARARSLPSRGAGLRLSVRRRPLPAARRPPAAGRRASQSAAARGSMPAGAPPPLGRMVQAGRPAGAHILEPGCRARDPLRERPGEGSGEVREPAAGPGGAHSGAAAARRGSGSGGFVLRSREEGGGRRRRAQCVSRSAVLDPARAPRRGGGEVRGCGRRRRWRTRFPCARHRLGGLCRGLRRRSAPLKLAGGSV